MRPDTLSYVERAADENLYNHVLTGDFCYVLDEIDWTIQLPYSDDFFAAIRACYNAQATNPEYQ